MRGWLTSRLGNNQDLVSNQCLVGKSRHLINIAPLNIAGDLDKGKSNPTAGAPIDI